MRKIVGIVTVFLAASLAAFGQASRFQSNIYTINSSAPQPGGLYPVLASPGASIAICNAPATGFTVISPGTISGPCTNYATTYSASGGIACTPPAQLTRDGSTTCVSGADAEGGFGIWIVGGNYQYTVTTAYGSFGPYDFTAQNTGGNIGPIVTSMFTAKLPVVNITHPDFAAGCPNPADPTGVLDSTCAIEQASTFAQGQLLPAGAGAVPAVYFPHGTYKISGDPRFPCGLHLLGDGPNASIIEETNNSEGVTITGTSFQPDPWDCMGSMEGLTFYTPNGHLYTATQLQLENAVGYTLRDIRVAGGGGRGIATLGSTERLKAYHIEIDTVRWPLLWFGNENHLWGLNIASPGFTQSDSYHYGDNNAVNGVVPNQSWPGGTLISANGNGTLASFYVQGANSGFKSTSPLVVGHHFQVTGTTGTVLDGIYQVTAVTNNVTSDPSSTCTSGNQCFEVQAASTVSGTATVTGASWLPALLPNRNAAVAVSGAEWEIDGGSIKALQDAGGMEVINTIGSRIANIYFEGFFNALSAGLVEGGLPPQTTLTQSLPGNTSPATATVADNSWFHVFVNDASDAAGISGNAIEMRILPQDFLFGSTAASAFVPGVLRGQYENVYAVMAGNGTTYISIRNVNGSTAPSGTAWPSGSLIAETANHGSFYGTLTLDSNHFSGIAPPSSNWYSDCVDNSQLVCAEIVAGSIPNGLTSFTTGQAGGNAGAQAFLTVKGGDFWFGGTEAQGQGYIKARGPGVVLGNISSQFGTALTGLATQGQIYNFLNVQEADGSYPFSVNSSPSAYFNSTQGTVIGSGGAFTQLINDASSVTGDNPGFSSFNLGRQYATSWCDYDTPASGHALNRWCVEGSPGITGSNAGFEYDSWSGSAWVNDFSISNGISNPGGLVGANLPLLNAANIFQQPNTFSLGTATAGATMGPLQNLAAYSQQLSLWSVVFGYSSITDNSATAPDGTNTADTLISNGGSTNQIASPGATLIANATYDTCIWLKGSVGGETVQVGAAQQNFIAATLTTSWQRYCASGSPLTSFLTRTFILQVPSFVSGSETFYAWGAQTVPGSEALGYFPTTATPQTTTLYGIEASNLYVAGNSASGVTFQTNATNNSSQTVFNATTSTTNAVGLTITPLSSSGGVQKWEITGAYTGNAATATGINGNGTANQVWGMNSGGSAQGWQTIASGVTWPANNDLVISNTTNAPTGLAPVNGDCVVGAGGVWTAASCAGGGGGVTFLNGLSGSVNVTAGTQNTVLVGATGHVNIPTIFQFVDAINDLGLDNSGATDSGAALCTYLNTANNVAVMFAAGTYKFTAQCTINATHNTRSSIALIGTVPAVSPYGDAVTFESAAANSDIIEYNNTSAGAGQQQGLIIENLQFLDTSSGNMRSGLHIVQANHVTLRDVNFAQFGGSQYSTGTATISSGTPTTVTGSGTTWTSAMAGPNGMFCFNGYCQEIASVNSATSITLVNNWQGAVFGYPSSSSYAVDYNGVGVLLDGGSAVSGTNFAQFMQWYNVSGRNNRWTVATVGSNSNLYGVSRVVIHGGNNNCQGNADSGYSYYGGFTDTMVTIGVRSNQCTWFSLSENSHENRWLDDMVENASSGFPPNTTCSTSPSQTCVRGIEINGTATNEAYGNVIEGFYGNECGQCIQIDTDTVLRTAMIGNNFPSGVNTSNHTFLTSGNGKTTATGFDWDFGQIAGLTLTGITGGTQCLQVNSSGTISGTGLGCASAPNFNQIGTGTNTTATMTVGTGATITYSGSGVINATAVETAVSSAAATYSILAAPSTTGNQEPTTIASFTINPSTGAVNISGPLTVPSCSGCGTSSITFPVTVNGTVTSGGIPYFNSTTQMSTSALLASKHVLLGGGAGGAPTSDANLDDGATTTNTLTYAGIGGITASNGPLTAAAPSGDAGLLALVGNTTNQTCPTNQFCIGGFSSASATAYGIQFPNTAPSGGQVPVFLTPTSSWSQASWATAVTVPGVSNVTGQSTSQSTVTLATSPAAGTYRIAYYADQSAVCTTGSNSVSFTFNWTDGTNARALTTGNMAMGTAQQTSGYLSGTVPIQVGSGNVTYTSTVTGTCATGTSTYDVHVTLEAL